jgi:hypothetical protein
MQLYRGRKILFAGSSSLAAGDRQAIDHGGLANYQAQLRVARLLPWSKGRKLLILEEIAKTSPEAARNFFRK